MPSVFDIVEQGEAANPFDVVEAESKPKPLESLSQIRLSPYEKADVESMALGRGKATTGMESGTELTTEIAKDPLGFAATLATIPLRPVVGIAQAAADILNPQTFLPESERPKEGVIDLESGVIRQRTPAEREERRAIQFGKPLYQPATTQLSPEGSDLERLVSRWSTPENLALMGGAPKQAAALLMTTMGPIIAKQAEELVKGEGSEEVKRDRINDLFALVLTHAAPRALKKGAPDAVPIREPEALPLETPPRSGEEMGARIPEPEKPATTETQAPANLQTKEIDFNTFKPPPIEARLGGEEVIRIKGDPHEAVDIFIDIAGDGSLPTDLRRLAHKVSMGKATPEEAKLVLSWQESIARNTQLAGDQNAPTTPTPKLVKPGQVPPAGLQRPAQEPAAKSDAGVETRPPGEVATVPPEPKPMAEPSVKPAAKPLVDSLRQLWPELNENQAVAMVNRETFAEIPDALRAWEALPPERQAAIEQHFDETHEAAMALKETQSPELIGMGGAVPSEFNVKGDFVSNMFAKIDADRAAIGKEPMPETQRRSWDEDNQRALARMNQEPDWIPNLIEDVKASPRPLMSWENAGVVWHRAKLKAEYNNALQRIAQAFDDGRTEDLAQAKSDAQIYENALQSLDETVGRSGTGSEAGRSLVAQKMATGDDWSLVELRLRKRKANDGAPLDEAQTAEVQKTFEAHQAKIKELETHLAETQKKLVDEEIKRAFAESKSAYEPRVLQYAERFASYMDKQGQAALGRLKERLSRTSTGVDPTILVDVSIYGASKITRGLTDFAKWSDTMIRDIGDWVKPHLQEAWEASQKVFEEKLTKVAQAKPEIADKVKRAVKKSDAAEKIADAKEAIETKAAKGKLDDIFPEVQKLVRSLVEQNPKIEREALIDTVHETLKAYIPEITRLQAMDAISGRGRFSLPSQDEISKTVRDLKTQTRLLGHQIDVREKRPLPRTGYQPEKLSDAARREEQRLNELKRKFGVVVTDPQKQLASVLNARKTYYRNRIADLTHEIRTREKIVKSKTPSPTDPQLEGMKSELKKLREEHAQIFQKSELTDAQRVALAEKAADRQIAELERQLKSGEIFPEGKAQKPTSAALEAKRAQLEALKAERDWARDLIQPAEDIALKEIRSESTALDNQIKKLEKDLASSRVFTVKGKPREQHPENAAKRAQLEALKNRRKWLQDQLQPKPEKDPVAIAIRARVAYMTRRIADLKDRMARGDYEPRKKKGVDVSQDPKVLTIKGELKQIDSQFQRGLALDRAKRRSPAAKIYAGVKEVLNLPKAIWSAFDLSAVGRQGGWLGAAHPIRAASSIVPMFEALMSEKRAFRIEQQILSRPNANKYADAKLYLASLDEFKLSRQEEIMMSRFANAIPGVRMSNRAFMTYLNKLRADSFDAMLKSRESLFSEPVSQAELNAIANYINVATGRGNLGKAAGLAEGLATVFWSPRLVASRFQLLAGQPLYRGSAKTRALIASEYARSLAGLGVLVGLGTLAGAELETDSRSSDFLKLKFGKTRVDIFGGLIQNTVLLRRLAGGETKTSKGKTMPAKSGDLAANFLRSKLTPALGQALDIRDIAVGQKPPPGHPQTVPAVAKHAVVPLAWQDILDMMEQQGVPKATAFQILSLFGAGVQNYEQQRKP